MVRSTRLEYRPRSERTSTDVKGHPAATPPESFVDLSDRSYETNRSYVQHRWADRCFNSEAIPVLPLVFLDSRSGR